jgi:hypothetical protein
MGSTIGDGFCNVTTAGTRVLLSSGTITDPGGPVKGVLLSGKELNTGAVVFGGASTVVAAVGTRRGTPLWARDTAFVETDDLADIGLDATVNGEGVVVTWVK